MKLFFDNLQELNQEFDRKLVELVSESLEDEEIDDDTNCLLLHITRITGLPAFYVLTPEGAVIGVLDYDHDFQIDTISYEELIDNDENLTEVVDTPDKIEAIVENEVKDNNEYLLLQEVESSVKRSVYTLLLTGWYELQDDVDTPEKLHQMIFSDLMVLDDELSTVIKVMFEDDPDKAYEIIAESIANIDNED